MMGDIVERLRAAHPNSAQRFAGSNILLEAADEIERLTKERDDFKDDYFRRHKDAGDRMERALVAESKLENLRKALETICAAVDREPVCGGDLDYPHGHNDWIGWRKKIMRPAVTAGRAALDAVKGER